MNNAFLDNSLPHNISEFKTTFSPTIRVLLNWDFLAQAQPSIISQSLPLADILALYTPWYPKYKNYQSGVAPLALSDIAADPSLLTVVRSKHMAKLATSLSKVTEPIVVPLYFDGMKTLILDGNHRLSTIAIYQLDTPVIGSIIQGTSDGQVLPDLPNLRIGV